MAVFRDRLRRLLPLAGGECSQRGIQVGGVIFAGAHCYVIEGAGMSGCFFKKSVQLFISAFFSSSGHTGEATR